MMKISRIGTGRWNATMHGEPITLGRLEQHLAIQDAAELSRKNGGVEVTINHDIAFRVSDEPCEEAPEEPAPIPPPDPEPPPPDLEPDPVELGVALGSASDIYPKLCITCKFQIVQVMVLSADKVTTTSLGEEIPEIYAISRGNDEGFYAPVFLRDIGVVGYVAVEWTGYDDTVKIWVRAGATFHLEPAAGFHGASSDTDTVKDPEPGRYLYEIDGIPAAGTDPIFLPPLTLFDTIPDVVSPLDLPSPGQPQFEFHDAEGAIVSWAPSEGADGYTVKFAGGEAHTSAPSIHLPNLRVGDWVCVYPTLRGQEGENKRCNTWRVSV